MYGYENDDVPVRALVFGLNSGVARVVKFEWINNAGTGNTEGEALDIQIAIEGQERTLSYRLFPITKAFIAGGNGETTDQNHPDFKKAVKEFNSCVTHFMHCFVSKETLQTALARPISNFKEFCKVLMSLLPKGYESISLDLFAQYQWQLKGEAKYTYLELPKKMSYGKWLCPHVAPIGKWKAVVVPEPTNDTPVALKYVDDAGNVHPFTRNGWFMNSNFAKLQKSDSAESADDIATGDQDMSGGTEPQAEGASTW